ncbi:UTP--glucose-1-phosphate uridylyltransferase-like [Glandiceps talaboti]
MRDTNGFYYNQFEEWAKNFPNVKILNDNTTSNETRLGAVACIHLAVTQFDIQESLIVIGGDTLFGSDFSLQEIITKYKGYNDNQGNTSLVLYNECNDDETHRHGILEIDEENKVVTFLEKPNPEDTPSRKACPCFYIYSKEVLNMLETFLHDHTDKPLVLRDAPGHFVKYITDRTVLFAEKTSQRFDIGNLQSYIECNDYFITNYEQVQ